VFEIKEKSKQKRRTKKKMGRWYGRMVQQWFMYTQYQGQKQDRVAPGGQTNHRGHFLRTAYREMSANNLRWSEVTRIVG